MVSQSTFLRSCSQEIARITAAFDRKGEQAEIVFRENNLIRLFQRQIKEIERFHSSPNTEQNRCFEKLDTDLVALKESIETIKMKHATTKAQAFCAKILEKIAEVDQILQAPSQPALKDPKQRRTFRLNNPINNESTPSTRNNATQTTKPLDPAIEYQQALSHQTALDINIKEGDIIDFDKEAAKARGIRGILNKGGNDCFQNAICQALLTKTFKKDVIDRLPNFLRKHFYKQGGIDSQALRKAIAAATKFKNPLSSQQDPHELFVALMDSIDQSDSQVISLAHPLQLISKDLNVIDKMQSFIEKRHIFFKAILFSFFIPLKAFYILWEKISRMLDEEEIEEIKITPAAPIELPQRTPKEAPNDINFCFFYLRTWNVESVPAEYKSDPNFGGQTNSAQSSDSAQNPPNFQNHITIPIEENHNGFNLQERFNNFLTDNNSICNSVANPAITAPKSELFQFENIPGALVLQIKRFEQIVETDENGRFIQELNGNIKFKMLKKFNPAEDFNLQLKINPEHFVESIRPETPVSMQLQSFIVHIGDSAKSGHYVSFRKVDGEWYYFNDSLCEKIKEEAAIRAAKHAYMYFFEKEDV